MQKLGTLKIRKDIDHYVARYNTLYFKMINNEYKKLNTILRNIIREVPVKKNTEIYKFLYSTGNIPRSGISIDNIYKDKIKINLRIYNKHKIKRDLEFFLNLFNTSEIFICDKKLKILYKSSKNKIYEDLKLIESYINKDIYLVRKLGLIGQKIIGG